MKRLITTSSLIAMLIILLPAFKKSAPLDVSAGLVAGDVYTVIARTNSLSQPWTSTVVMERNAHKYFAECESTRDWVEKPANHFPALGGEPIGHGKCHLHVATTTVCQFFPNRAYASDELLCGTHRDTGGILNTDNDENDRVSIAREEY